MGKQQPWPSLQRLYHRLRRYFGWSCHIDSSQRVLLCKFYRCISSSGSKEIDKYFASYSSKLVWCDPNGSNHSKSNKRSRWLGQQSFLQYSIFSSKPSGSFLFNHHYQCCYSDLPCCCCYQSPCLLQNSRNVHELFSRTQKTRGQQQSSSYWPHFRNNQWYLRYQSIRQNLKLYCSVLLFPKSIHHKYSQPKHLHQMDQHHDWSILCCHYCCNWLLWSYFSSCWSWLKQQQFGWSGSCLVPSNQWCHEFHPQIARWYLKLHGVSGQIVWVHR